MTDDKAMVTTAIAPDVQQIATFSALRDQARQLGPRRVAVVVADDEVALTAAYRALQLGIAAPVLLGDASKIRAKAAELALTALLSKAELIDTADASADAVRMARDGDVEVLLKGH
jgi:phosphotransacetylase